MELQEIDEFRELQRESYREKIYNLRKHIFDLQCKSLFLIFILKIYIFKHFKKFW